MRIIFCFFVIFASTTHALTAMMIARLTATGYKKFKEAQKFNINWSSRNAKSQVMAINTDILRLNTPYKYTALEESLQKEIKDDIHAFTKYRMFSSRPEESFKQLAGKTILLNESELAAAKVLLKFHDNCKLSGPSNQCTTYAATSISKIFSRISEMEKLMKEQNTPSLEQWKTHIKSVVTSLMLHGSSLPAEIGNQITDLSKSVIEDDI